MGLSSEQSSLNTVEMTVVNIYIRLQVTVVKPPQTAPFGIFGIIKMAECVCKCCVYYPLIGEEYN